MNLLRALLRFPLANQAARRQFALVAVLLTGLQIAFPPLALALEAGFAMQVARRILCGDGVVEMPARLDWKQVLVDGTRRWGVILLFTLPGLVATGVVLLAGGWLAWASGGDTDGLRLAAGVLVIGLSLSILLVILGAEISNAAALHVLTAGSFGAAFQARAWGPVLRARLVQFELTGLLLILAELVLYGLLALMALPAILVCIGPPFLFAGGAVYLRLVSTAACAKIYREGLASLPDHR